TQLARLLVAEPVAQRLRSAAARLQDLQRLRLDLLCTLSAAVHVGEDLVHFRHDVARVAGIIHKDTVPRDLDRVVRCGDVIWTLDATRLGECDYIRASAQPGFARDPLRGRWKAIRTDQAARGDPREPLKRALQLR